LFGFHLTIEASPSRRIKKTLIFPTYGNFHTLAIVQPVETRNFLTLAIVQPTETRNLLTLAIVKHAETRNFLTLPIVQHVETRYFRTLCIEQLAEILQNRVFTKENTTSSLRESYSPLFLQEFKLLILLKTKDRFTSLTVIGMTKIMCNNLLCLAFIVGCPNKCFRPLWSVLNSNIFPML
jgi:hypothetical protein